MRQSSKAPRHPLMGTYPNPKIDVGRKPIPNPCKVYLEPSRGRHALVLTDIVQEGSGIRAAEEPGMRRRPTRETAGPTAAHRLSPEVYLMPPYP